MRSSSTEAYPDSRPSPLVLAFTILFFFFFLSNVLTTDYRESSKTYLRSNGVAEEEIKRMVEPTMAERVKEQRSNHDKLNLLYGEMDNLRAEVDVLRKQLKFAYADEFSSEDFASSLTKESERAAFIRWKELGEIAVTIPAVPEGGKEDAKLPAAAGAAHSVPAASSKGDAASLGFT